jgi:hypothetical protein
MNGYLTLKNTHIPDRYTKTKYFKLNNNTYKVTESKDKLMTRPHCMKKNRNAIRIFKCYEVKTDDGWKFIKGVGLNTSR